MKIRVLLPLLAAIVYAVPVFALDESGDSAGEYRFTPGGSLNIAVAGSNYPDDSLLYRDDEVDWLANLRLLAEGFAGEHWRFTCNLLQTVRTASVLDRSGVAAAVDVERSGAFYLEEDGSGNSRAALVADSAYASFGGPDYLWSAGRQPINLSVTFYFTPNDFFAPFSAGSFYRVYKPGVDALRYDRSMGELSQLNVIGVAGYSPDGEEDSGWEKAPEWRRTSLLGRFTAIAGSFEWGLLGGVVRKSAVIGGSLQGEIGQWLGLRAEGNWSGGGNNPDGLRLSLGFEHRFESSLTLRFEQYHNGIGYDSIKEAAAALSAGKLQAGYPGRNYSGLDISYEFGPLLQGEFLLLRNWTDHSGSCSIYAVYSLSNESELALSATVATGKHPTGGIIQSELGAVPDTVGLEYRLYF